MRSRLSLLYFLQFGVWGCYLTCFGQFLGSGGLGTHIAWFYAAIGVVSIITPALMGRLADRFIRPERLLGICHVIASAAMFAAWSYAMSHPVLDFRIFYPLYLLFLAFYMPTMALANTTSFALLKSRGIRPVDAFPSIRIWGTVGFVAAMWTVNCMYWHDGVLGMTFDDSNPFARFRFQYTSMQLLCTSLTGLVTALYVFTIPSTVRTAGEEPCRGSVFNPRLLRKFFSNPATRIFLLFAACSGVCLQISNGFATPFITHFTGLPEYAGSLAAGNATMLFSLSQISEAAFILAVGVSMKRMGIRGVLALGLAAWSLRFLFLGLGNPGDGLWMLTASMIVYGIAFNFITIAGHLYMEQVSDTNEKGFGQGLMMLMSNGIGATIGTAAAGDIINRWCSWEMVTLPGSGEMTRLFMGEWIWPWLIFAGYAFLVCLLWLAFFRYSGKKGA